MTGFLEPNGSGKTTTLTCLAGLLTPTRGTVDVPGHVPSERHPELLRRLGLVMGQRWRLVADLPVEESFELTPGGPRVPVRPAAGGHPPAGRTPSRSDDHPGPGLRASA